MVLTLPTTAVSTDAQTYTIGLDDDSPQIMRNLSHQEKEKYWCE